MWSTGLQSTGHPQVAGILALLALRNSALSTAGTGPAELSAVKCCLCPLLVRPKLQPFSTESIPRGDCPKPQLAGQDEQHCYEQGGQGIVI